MVHKDREAGEQLDVAKSIFRRCQDVGGSNCRVSLWCCAWRGLSLKARASILTKLGYHPLMMVQKEVQIVEKIANAK